MGFDYKFIFFKDIPQEITVKFKSLQHYPIIFISALTKQRIHRVSRRLDVYARSIKKYQQKLNELLKNL